MPSVRPTVPMMQWVIRVATLLVLGAGAPLMIAPGRTDEFFVFPIDPALTAGFIGSNYWAAVVIEGWSSLRRRWVDARSALFGIFAFSSLTGVVSIVNIGQFDLASAFTWIWLAVYTLFPVMMVVAWVRQRRAEGVDDDRAALPSPLRMLLGLIAIVLLPIGAGLMLYPAEASAVWAWELTTADASYRTAGGTSVEPYIGCWLVGIGLVVGGALLENDAHRARPIFAGMVALLVLQVLTLIRLGEPIDWSRPQAWGLAGALGLIGVTGVWGCVIRSSRVVR